MPEEIAGAGAAVAETITGAGDGATAAADTTGADAGAGQGAGEGAAPAGDTAAGEGAAAAGEAGAGEGEGEAGKGGGEGETGDEFADADGRRVDDRTRKALAAVKKVDPDSAKLLADTYHRAQRIVKEVGAKNLSEAVNKVVALSAVMESVGGEEGLTALNDEVTDYRNEITQFAEGDPQLAEALYSANPEGLAKSVSTSLDLLGSKDPERFDQVVIPAMVARLEKAGFYNSMKQLAEFIKEGDGQKAYDLTAQISKWFDEAKGFQKRQLDLKERKNPEQERLDRERQEFEQQKAQSYENQIGVDVNRMNNGAMSKLVEPFFREMKMPNEGRREFINGLQQRIWKLMKDDKTFQMQARAIKSKGDAASTAEFVHNKFVEFLPDAFRMYRNWLYPNYSALRTKKTAASGTAGTAAAGNGKTAPAAAAAATATGEIRLAAGQRPRNQDVDWEKTSTLDWIVGKATLRNGKTVKFDINAPANKL